MNSILDRLILYWGSTGDKSDPGTGQELNGYDHLQDPPHDEFNHLMANMAGRVPLFATLGLADALIVPAPTSPSGAVMAAVNEHDPTKAMLAELWDYQSAADATGSQLVTSGLYVYLVIDGDTVVQLNRATGGLLGTVTTGMSAVYALAHDGKRLYVGGNDGGNRVVKSFADDDLATVIHTSPALGTTIIRALYSDGLSVFVAMAPKTGAPNQNTTVVRLNADGLAAVWWADPSGDGSGDMYTVVSDGYEVWAGGDEDSSNFTIYRLNYDTGTGSGIGALITGVTGRVSDLALCNVPGQVAGSSGVGRLLAVGDADSGGNFAVLLTLGTAPISLWSVGRGVSVDAQSCAWDGTFFYVGHSNDGGDSVSLIEPVKGEIVNAIGRAFQVLSVEHDGFSLFVAGNRDTGDDALCWRHYTNPRPGIVRRCAGTERYRWPQHRKFERIDLPPHVRRGS